MNKSTNFVSVFAVGEAIRTLSDRRFSLLCRISQCPSRRIENDEQPIAVHHFSILRDGHWHDPAKEKEKNVDPTLSEIASFTTKHGHKEFNSICS